MSGSRAAVTVDPTTAWCGTRTTGACSSRAQRTTPKPFARRSPGSCPRWDCVCRRRTLITHIDEGLDFLGWHIQRRRKRGTNRRYVYTYPSAKALKAVTGKVKTRCRQNINLPLETLLRQLNPVLRGWTAHFRPGVSATAFSYLRAFTWRQVIRWLRRKHPAITWKELRRRFCSDGWWPADGDVILFNPSAVRTTRYRYRGTKIPSPWPSTT